ncbi:MAG: helicase, partial [Alphaproteobacteria bacterium]|nr:helicase [Alphaproteobacteria bacterium]
PAPNDHMELGNQSAFLGVMPANEMLMRWFINDTAEASQQWRLKGHAEQDFWDWMASWSRMAQSPADLGFDASRYQLPELKVIRHRTTGDVKPMDGALFVQELSATNLHDVKRQTSQARAEACAALDDGKSPMILWCDTDYEADALKAIFRDAVEVRGSMPIEKKEQALEAFSLGQVRQIITKPGIAGYGLNWQHCADMVFVGRSFSYELWYQAVRRSWRFGQKKPVNVHIIVAEGEDQIGRVIDRKADDHASMKASMVQAMRRAVHRGAVKKVSYNPTHRGEIPSWLKSVA